jgi:glycosyltransferase involved in cell wall biosynthesis
VHVLLISYRFPPQPGVGAIRPAKFAKYLVRFGFRVTVLAASAENGRDETLLRDLPAAVRVIRLRERGPLAAWRRLRPGRRLLWRSLWMAGEWLILQSLVPDDSSGFVRPALRAGAGLRADPPDVILASGGPWSSFVAAERISRRLGVPYVLDYRDPWTAAPAGWLSAPGFLPRLCNPSLERRLVSRATAIIAAHEEIPALLDETFRGIGVERHAYWIPNGYDPEDFGDLPARRSDVFVLNYAGALYGGRTLRPVAEALEDLCAAGTIPRPRARLRVLGPPAKRARSMLAGLLPDQLDAPGRVPYSESIASMTSAAVNVHVSFKRLEDAFHVPVKVYEYLRAGRAILALCPPGASARLIEEARAGWVVAPGDREALRRVLARAYEDWEAGRALPVPDPGVARRFDRSRGAMRLGQILERICGPGTVKGPAAGRSV